VAGTIQGLGQAKLAENLLAHRFKEDIHAILSQIHHAGQYFKMKNEHAKALQKGLKALALSLFWFRLWYLSNISRKKKNGNSKFS
jgi:hypothetical protein